jgi:hypothetical protein
VISCPTSLVIENHQVTGKDSGLRLCNISTAKRGLAMPWRLAVYDFLRDELRPVLAVFANRE